MPLANIRYYPTHNGYILHDTILGELGEAVTTAGAEPKDYNNCCRFWGRKTHRTYPTRLFQGGRGMPLVTLTCKPEYYPSDVPLSQTSGFPRTQQLCIIGFARALPTLIVNNSAQLHLDPGTPEKGVQVDIQKFHTHAVNAVDLWIKVELAEDSLPVAQRHELREMMITLVRTWLKEYNLHPKWAIDIFFGPATGCMTATSGEILERW